MSRRRATAQAEHSTSSTGRCIQIRSGIDRLRAADRGGRSEPRRYSVPVDDSAAPSAGEDHAAAVPVASSMAGPWAGTEGPSQKQGSRAQGSCVPCGCSSAGADSPWQWISGELPQMTGQHTTTTAKTTEVTLPNIRPDSIGRNQRCPPRTNLHMKPRWLQRHEPVHRTPPHASAQRAPITPQNAMALAAVCGSTVWLRS